MKKIVAYLTYPLIAALVVLIAYCYMVLYDQQTNTEHQLSANSLTITRLKTDSTEKIHQIQALEQNIKELQSQKTDSSSNVKEDTLLTFDGTIKLFDDEGWPSNVARPIEY